MSAVCVEGGPSVSAVVRNVDNQLLVCVALYNLHTDTGQLPNTLAEPLTWFSGPWRRRGSHGAAT